MHVTGPFVIATSVSMVSNWIQVFKKYTNLSVTSLSGTQEEREATYSGRLNTSLYYSGGRKDSRYPVIITTYEEASKNKQQLNTMGPNTISADFTHFIIDEGEGFERYRCALLSSLNHNRAAMPLFLPASPINCPKDMLTLLHFLVSRWFDNADVHVLSLLKSADDCNEEKSRQVVAKLQTILRAFTVHGA